MTKKNGSTPPPITYAPEVESRRDLYKGIAEALVTLTRAQSRTAPEALDVESPGWTSDEPDSHILWNGIEDHLRALFENLIVTYDDDFLRVLYVELRLYFDQKMFECAAGTFEYLSAAKREKERRRQESINSETPRRAKGGE
jgi:hypothetical protein